MISEILISLFAIPFTYFFITYINHLWEINDYPPGPFPLPIIGNLHLMSEKTYESMRDISQKYGSVFSLSFGMNRVVVVNSIEQAREAMIKKAGEFSGRPTNMPNVNMWYRGVDKSIAFTDYGKTAIFLRKLGHSSLKFYGEGMKNLEHLILRETNELSGRLEALDGTAVNPRKQLSLTVVNVICTMVFGDRYDVDDDEFHSVLRYFDLALAAFEFGDPAGFLPWLKYFPSKTYTLLNQAMAVRDPYLHGKLMEHKASFNADNIRDFTDSLLKVYQDEKKLNAVGFVEVDDDNLEMILNDVFMAGGDTIVTTMTWVFVYFLHWPQYQEDLIKQIAAATNGGERKPDLSDRNSIPLVQAVINETLRFASPTPLALPHKATVDTSLDAYPVPKDTIVFFNIWYIHRDPKHWDNPDVFDPYRWIDPVDGKFIPGRNESYLPFSAGKRGCLGESMGKSQLFLIVSRLFAEFEIAQPDGEELPSLVGKTGASLRPLPFKCIFKKRK